MRAFRFVIRVRLRGVYSNRMTDSVQFEHKLAVPTCKLCLQPIAPPLGPPFHQRGRNQVFRIDSHLVLRANADLIGPKREIVLLCTSCLCFSPLSFFVSWIAGFMLKIARGEDGKESE